MSVVVVVCAALVAAACGSKPAPAGVTVSGIETGRSLSVDKRVAEPTDRFTPTGPAHTEFHVSNPGGWPTGRYRLEVSLNGTPAGTKQVEVK